jgi:putative MATE family efflux protein
MKAKDKDKNKATEQDQGSENTQIRPMGANRTEAMGKDPIWGLMLRFSGPAIVSMLVASSYNIVDAIFVGRLGPEALAALTVAFPVMMIFMAIAMGTGIGAASLISRRLGAGEREEANRVASISITLSILVGALMTLIVLPNMEPLLRLFGAGESILPLAKSYLSVLATFAVVEFFPLVATNVIRAEGRPVFSSTIMIISALGNIVLDPILIFGLGPIPAMGVGGAAIATAGGRAIGAAVLIIYFASGKSSYKFRPRYFMLNMRIVFEIYRVGIASIAHSAAGSFVMALVNRTAASFGVVPLAVMGVLFRASSFAFMPCVGLGQGVLPLVGYNFGAKQKERIGEIVVKAGLASLAWGALCWIVAMLISTQIMSIFNTDPQFLTEGSPAFRIFACGFFLIGAQMILSHFFQGIGKGLPSLVLASARQIIFLLPLLLIFPRIFGLTGLWISFPISDVLSIVLTLTWTSIEFRRQGIKFRLRYQRVDLEKDPSGTSAG